MHSEEQATSRVFHACIHPALSGLFGSIASLVAKHTFSADFGGWDKSIEAITHGNRYMDWTIRIILFLLTLYLNSLMLKFFINSLKRNGATVAKVLSLSISFFMNGVISYFYFGEPLEPQWGVGLFLIMVGIFFLTKDKDNQDNEKPHAHHTPQIEMIEEEKDTIDPDQDEESKENELVNDDEEEGDGKNSENKEEK